MQSRKGWTEEPIPKERCEIRPKGSVLLKPKIIDQTNMQKNAANKFCQDDTLKVLALTLMAGMELMLNWDSLPRLNKIHRLIQKTKHPFATNLIERQNILLH